MYIYIYSTVRAQGQERLIGAEDIERRAGGFRKELTVDLGFRILLLIANIFGALAMCQTLYFVRPLHLTLTRAL